ncbi:hypothetical protein RND81_11G083500 [Saponaria officinalis]|uniref:F-box domain-containing protein n=1 Tax=Saponaria officinalis TaxID=3572 RepID=A0AAW1HJF0_SAPOF
MKYQVTSSTADYISELPDDILGDILSLSTVRESFRVRCLSPRWKDLPDTRFVLQFDAYNIFGADKNRYGCRTKFVEAVDQFFKIWSARKTDALKIEFGLGNEYASHIDGWIATVSGKEVEELDLDFSVHNPLRTREMYVFPCYVMGSGSYLQRLRLRFCNLTSISDVCTSWLSKLRTIELTCVTLCSADIESILSSSLNLESLSLFMCPLEGYLCAQHPSLKKLVMHEHCQRIELNCPHLEIFDFSGSSDFTFANVARLREASFNFNYKIEGSSAVYNDLARNAPRLQTLSIFLTTEVPPLLPSTKMSSLKRLDLLIRVPMGYDLFTITHLLYACPVLEELLIKLCPKSYSEQSVEREYVDRPHFHLKEVIINGLSRRLNPLRLVEYLLRNSMSLLRMVFVGGSQVCGRSKFIKL